MKKQAVHNLISFLSSPQGQYVLAWERQHFNQFVANIFGFRALTIGLPAWESLAENRMPLRIQCWQPNDVFCLDSTVGNGLVQMVAYPEELPFASESVDLVVLPHVLDFSLEPHRVLREVERVLVPEGQLVISAFNPWSLWGFRQWFGRFGASCYLPPSTQFLSLSRLKDWLKLLSFDVHLGCVGVYVPWAHTKEWLQRWQFLERAGDRWWPIGGAVYMLSAVKRVRGARLVGALSPLKAEPQGLLAHHLVGKTEHVESKNISISSSDGYM